DGSKKTSLSSRWRLNGSRRRRFERAKHFVVVFAGTGERCTNARPAAADKQWQQHHIRDLAIIRLHWHETTTRFQVHVIEQLLRPHDRGVGKSCGIELHRELIGLVMLQNLTEAMQQLGPAMHALLVGPQ